MTLEIEKIFLSNEFHSETEINPQNTSTDVIVFLKSGEKYVASFFTFLNIEAQRLNNLKTGAYLNGDYFWVNNMLLIEDCSLQKIENVIQNLIEEGDFIEAFRKI